ncbi:hypothetical protein JCM10450v2_000537 [Rhodotorula kratochvilovae]
MDEPSPWGAPSDSPTLPRPPSPKLSYSPPAASTSFSAPAWVDEGGGWGGAVDDYVPGAFSSSGFGTGDDGPKPSERDDEDIPPPTNVNSGAGGGWAPESPELPRFSTGEPSAPADDVDPPTSTGFGSSPPLPPVALPLPSFPSDSVDEHATAEENGAENEDDDGDGWGGASPDLPPIGALRIAAPPSPTEETARDVGWGGADEDPAAEEDEPPLPTLGDLFPASKQRRESAELAQAGEQGGDAWGSSQGWEERMRIEAEAREKQRIAEAKAAGLEPEQERKKDGQEEGADAKGADAAPADDKPAPKSALASIFRFRKSAEDTATRAAESAKDTASRAAESAKDTAATAARGAAALARSASTRPSLEQDSQAPGGATEERPAAKSWLSRVAARQGDPGKPGVEDDDPNSLGVEEVLQGESGRTASPEPQASAIGRLFSRLKRPASAPVDGQQQSTSPRTSSEQTAPDLRVTDLDALGVAKLQAHAQAKKDMYDYDEDEEDDRPPPSGFFGSRSKSTSRIPDAPPEDDFGGLLGAFSVAPAAGTLKAKASSSSFDPFDPLSDSFDALPAPQAKPSARPVASPALTRPPPPPVAPSSRSAATRPHLSHPQPAAPASFGGLQPSITKPPVRASSPLDDFDAFFDSVAVSTGHKPAAPTASAPSVLSPVPRSTQPTPAGLPSLRASSGSVRTSIVSPPPRLTISPPVRMSTASPASSTGRSTPIMPLAPPPPPSQPLAANRLVGLDAPPAAAPAQRVSSPSIPAPLAPAPALSPALTAAKGKTPSPSPQPQRTASGPLSLDDLSFFES